MYPSSNIYIYVLYFLSNISKLLRILISANLILSDVQFNDGAVEATFILAATPKLITELSFFTPT